MNTSLQCYSELPNIVVCIARGLIHPPPTPQPKRKPGRPSNRTEEQYAKELAWLRTKRQANIKAGLRYDGQPRTRKWERIIEVSEEEHKAVVHQRRLECQRKRRADPVYRLEMNRRQRMRTARLARLGLTSRDKARKRRIRARAKEAV